MKTIWKAMLLAIVSLITLTSVVGCYGPGVTGSGNITEKEYALTGFTRVQTSSTFHVEIVRSDTYRVTVKTSDNLFQYVEATVSGDTLRLRLRPFINFRMAQFQATISIPDLRGVVVSGASAATVSGFQSAGAIEVHVSGASRLELADLKATGLRVEVNGASRLTGKADTQDADFQVSGASTLELSGSAATARIEASGASSVRTDSFTVGNADVRLSGASNTTIAVQTKLDLEVSGASRLTYSGSPVLGRVEVTGASTLTKR